MIWKILFGWCALIVVFELIRRTLSNSSRNGINNSFKNTSLQNDIAFFSPIDLQANIERCWKREIRRTAICADLPRLAWKITIHTPERTVLKPPESATLALRHLFLTLDRLLHRTSHNNQQLDSLFAQIFPDPLAEAQFDLSRCVDAYLQRAMGPISQSSLLRLLTTCGQHIVAPVIQKLKAIFLNAQIPFKDVRGGWFISIHFSNDDITVIHRKREQSYEESPSKHFEFVWELRLSFDLQVQTLQRVGFYITEVYFPDNMQQMYREHIRQVMAPFLSSV